MERTVAEIKALLEEYEIKFIRLAFCDIFGRQKNIAITASSFEHAVTSGVSFDASAIDGFANVNESDLFLHPDLNTFSILPWRPHESSVARFYCNISYPDGRPFEGDGRFILSEIEKEAYASGYSFLVGPECEFYLFETDNDGNPTRKPFDRAGYFDIAPLDRGENIRREICLALEEMNLSPERSHHESGPGQNEIDFRCSSPLKAADDLMTLRTAVKAISYQNGLFASFLPKPLVGESGSGLHINLSVFENDENLFSGFVTERNHKAASFLAGILRRIGDITVFSNPLPGSYSRLGKCEAPSVISWSAENRSTLVRVPAATGIDSRIEIRSPDPSCNPYLVIALLVAAGFEGIKDNLELAPSTDRDIFSPGGRSGLKEIPHSLQKAIKNAKCSEFVRSVLPGKLVDDYLSIKSREALGYERSENAYSYELDRYFPYI